MRMPCKCVKRCQHGARGALTGMLRTRQLYRGLDIATAKVTEAETQGVPHHLLSVLPPGQAITVREFRDRALRVISGSLRSCIPCLGTTIAVP